MKTFEQTLSDVLVNWVAPIKSLHPEMTMEDFKPPILSRIVKLYHEGKIDSLKVRKWLQERIGERKLEESLGLPSISPPDLFEVEALERR